MNNIESISDEYYEALGKPKPGQPFGLIDHYRFYITCRHLAPGSVLDVGAYYGDFLKLARQNGHHILGTEVNKERVKFVNEILGENVVKLDFRNGILRNFSDRSVDNVVCTEVIEHLPDHNIALSELCRVARKRVIITVPFKESIQHVLCLHCFKYTPYSGHLHSYDFKTFHNLVPENWHITQQKSIAKRLTHLIARRFKLPRSNIMIQLIQHVDLLMPGRGRLLFVVLSNKHPTS